MNMNLLIETINKLQDVFAVVNNESVKINLPQIVVVGSQSSGKSSVLESLVGKSFLPRGVGIVTRAPLILQIIKYTTEMRDEMLKITNDDSIKEWACFPAIPGKIFHNFDEVKCAIENLTDQFTGNNKGITRKSIVLKVYTRLYTLTFVDLPGFTKVPIDDQPKDIDEQIKKIVLEYVEQPNSIILAVVTANTDPSTSESLQIAKKVDPNGERTIAVVTKLDIIDQGTLEETKQFLCGNRIPVKLGIIGVVNRSQKDIDINKSMEETIKSEMDFFKKYYPDIYKKHGNRMLADTLQKILLNHIKSVYPALLKHLKDIKTKHEDELKTFLTSDNKDSFILGLIKDISRSYCDTIKGNRKDVSDKIIMGGARIVKVLKEKYDIDNINALYNLNDNQINIILLNTAGNNSSSFINEKALEIMINKQVQYLIEPSMSIVDLVCEEMDIMFNSIDQNILDTLKRYSKINTDVRGVLSNMLESTVTNIKDFIKLYIETHRSSLNIANPDFILHVVKSSDEIRNAYVNVHMANIKNCIEHYRNACNTKQYMEIDEKAKNQAFEQMLCSLNNLKESNGSSRQVQMHKILTQSYFNFIKNCLRDFVPKFIQHNMVNFILNKLEYQLINDISIPYYSKTVEEVLDEEKGIAEERRQTLATLTAVNKALKIMGNVRHF